jgi:hypothetical protein
LKVIEKREPLKGDKGDQGDQGLKGDKGDDGDPGQNAAAVSEDRIREIIQEVLAGHKPPDEPTDENVHLVLVADTNANYWSRLKVEYDVAKGYFSSIRLAPPPDFSVPLPQLVSYQGGIPVTRIRGLRSVREVLHLISRGENPFTKEMADGT